MTEIFMNGMGLLIVWDRKFDICPIWLWIYTKKVRLEHRPNFIMVVLLSPCSFRDMPHPDRIEWTLTRSGLIPAWWSLRVETENRIAVIRYVGVTVTKGFFPVNMYSKIYYSVLPPFDRMWCIWRVRSLQGHRSEVKDLRCIVFPMHPFLLLVILRLE